MGGGLSPAHLSLGLLEAFFDAYINFLINYKAFHFVGDAGIDVGVSFGIGLLFVIFYISVDISAHLYIEGLPFRGSVYVNSGVLVLLSILVRMPTQSTLSTSIHFIKCPPLLPIPPLLPQRRAMLSQVRLEITP
jgi:hypothetical protein